MSQIDLFTKRARRPKPPSEIQLHCAIADTIRLDLAKGWVFLHPANGGWRTVAEAGLFKRLGVRAGASDILLYGPPHATVHALEIKAPGNKPTEDQFLFMLQTREAGGKADWVDNYDDAIRVLKEWGALRRKVTVT